MAQMEVMVQWAHKDVQIVFNRKVVGLSDRDPNLLLSMIMGNAFSLVNRV